jgi:hypothetical protein
MDGRGTGATPSGERVSGGPVGQAGAQPAARSPGLDGGRLEAAHPHRHRSAHRSAALRRRRQARHNRPRARPGRHHRRPFSRTGRRRPRARPSRLHRGRRVPRARRRPANSLPTGSHNARSPSSGYGARREAPEPPDADRRRATREVPPLHQRQPPKLALRQPVREVFKATPTEWGNARSTAERRQARVAGTVSAPGRPRATP